MADPVILTGLRLDGVPSYRRRNWQFARSRWEWQLGWPIFEGHYDDPGPFSLARASNRAAQLAGDWQVALYVGADFMLANGSQADAAVRVALATGQLTFAHDFLVHLSETETADLLARGPEETIVSAETRHLNTFSGSLAITHELWDRVGGFDERFLGWGYDDLAFWASCCAIGGGFQRVKGDAFHLHHPRTREENEGNPHHEENGVLGRRYLAAKGNRRAMLSILEERS